MRLSYVAIGWALQARELSRSRIALLMLITIPTLFYTLVALTTTTRPVVFKLASISGETAIQVSERSESLVFIGLAGVGVLTSFLALTLVQKNAEAHRRLVLCGYRASELLVAKLLALLCAIAAIAGCASAVLPILFFRPQHGAAMLLGFLAAGYVYGCYGLLVGTMVRGELEGILFVSLLANIDAGWLQNPLFYADAQNKAIIRWLPAYCPSQVSMVAAFSDHSIHRALLGSIAYGSVLLAIASVLYWVRMPKRPRPGPAVHLRAYPLDAGPCEAERGRPGA